MAGKIGGFAVLALLVSGGVFLWLGMSDAVFPRSKTLFQMGQPVTESDRNRKETSLNFASDRSGSRTATATLEIRRIGEDTYSGRISIWHREGTVIDSLRLRVGTGLPPEIALKTPGGFPWPPLQTYERTRDARAVVLDMPDLGDVQGRGTMTLEFLMGSGLGLAQPESEFPVRVEFSLYEDSFPRLVKREAVAGFTSELPAS